VLESCFSGIRVIKTTLSEKDQIEKFDEVLGVRINKEKHFLKMNLVIQFFSMLVNNAGIIIVIFIGSAYVVDGTISLGTLLLFIIYLQKLVEPIWTISWFYASSKQVFRYVDRLKETEIEEFDYPDEETDKTELKDFASLKVEDLTFTFDDTEKKTLHNISFELKKGESLAVVGPLGSGKSTLLEIIAGNLIADSGRILINNVPINKIAHASLASIIGYIKQENVLFSETIRSNLELGDSFSQEEIDKKHRNCHYDRRNEDIPERAGDRARTKRTQPVRRTKTEGLNRKNAYKKTETSAHGRLHGRNGREDRKNILGQF
jgi:ATP-binding cassette, subfamily B, multidrug efflux pump